MTERNASVNPNICIHLEVQEVTDGRGYYSPQNRSKFRDEATGCQGCPKPRTITAFSSRPDWLKIMSPDEVREVRLFRELFEGRLVRTAKRTGKYLRR